MEEWVDGGGGEYEKEGGVGSSFSILNTTLLLSSAGEGSTGKLTSRGGTGRASGIGFIAAAFKTSSGQR